MLCGINWGGDPTKPELHEAQSFFSDSSVNDYPYRNRLVRWFEIFGHPLIRKYGDEEHFERSIVQTNWLQGRAHDMRGVDLTTLCARSAGSFIHHVDVLKPKLIVLVGIALFSALNSPTVLAAIENLLGPSSAPRTLQKTVIVSDRKMKSFRLGLRNFASASVVALPHPTGSKGLADAYIAAFKDEIGPVISKYRLELESRFSTR